MCLVAGISRVRKKGMLCSHRPPSPPSSPCLVRWLTVWIDVRTRFNSLNHGRPVVVAFFGVPDFRRYMRSSSESTAVLL